MTNRPYEQDTRIRRGEQPWRRLLAFWFDMALFTAPAGFLLYWADPLMYEKFMFMTYALGPSLALVVSALPFSALMIRLTGTTPGKALMGLRVISAAVTEPDTDQEPPLGFTRLYKRALISFVLGAGLMVTSVMPFSLFFSYRSLKYRGVSYWDAVARTRVVYLKLMPWRVAMFILLYLILEILSAVPLFKLVYEPVLGDLLRQT